MKILRKFYILHPFVSMATGYHTRQAERDAIQGKLSGEGCHTRQAQWGGMPYKASGEGCHTRRAGRDAIQCKQGGMSYNENPPILEITRTLAA